MLHKKQNRSNGRILKNQLVSVLLHNSCVNLLIYCRRPSLSLMEKQLIFMTDEELASSYIQKGLQQASKQQVKLPKPNECYIPGRKLFDKKRSKLTKTEQLQCLNALKCFQSGKDMTKLKVSEQRDMEMYNVR